MDDVKKKIVVGYCVAIIISILIVPWKIDLHTERYSTKLSKGYSFVFSPPFPTTTIDFSILFLEIILITAGAVIIYVMRDKLFKYQDGLKADENKIGDNLSSKYINIVFVIFFYKLSTDLRDSVLDLLSSNYYGENRLINVLIGATCGGVGALFGLFITKLINKVSISRKKKIIIAWGVCISLIVISAAISDLMSQNRDNKSQQHIHWDFDLDRAGK